MSPPAARAGQPAKPLSVSELTRQIKRLLEEGVGWARVEGELSNWKVSPSGHAYFVLKDAGATISGVMFRGALGQISFKPRDGQQLIVEGRVTVYEARGQYQIIAERMQEAGLGALFQKFNELKAKLEQEGLFDPARKKPLPMLPRRIGLVTSTQGAAIRDMLNVLTRRFANIEIVIAPCRVQGVEAAGEIAAAIAMFNRHQAADVLIVGRGGGSIEDLWAFNEEIVARAIAGSKIPVVSAVGHETDFTIADFAADLRAPTPSAAAEIVVASRAELADRVGSLSRRLTQTILARAQQARLRLDGLVNSYGMRRPVDRMQQARQQLDDLSEQLGASAMRMTRDLRHKVEALEARLRALGPRQALARGYAIVTRVRDGRVVTQARQVKVNEQIRIELSEGSLRAATMKDEDDFLDGMA